MPTAATTTTRPTGSTTIPSRRDPTLATKRGRFAALPERPAPWAPLVAVVLGLILVGMATPRLVAGLLVAPYDDELREMAKGHPVEGQVLAAAGLAYEDALAWHDEANAAAELAGINYVLARHLGFGGDAGRLYLERTLAAARRAVAGNPALPYAWLQIAIALEALEGPSPKAVAALIQSMRRAPYQPRLAVLRAGLALKVWPLLDAEARALAGQQVLLAAKVDPAGLAGVVPSPALWRVAQDILLTDPALLVAVEAARRR